jgi:hypothetical protein
MKREPMRKSTLFCSILATLGFNLSGGCAKAGSDSDYNEAVSSGQTTIPLVVAFEKLYPGSNHFISHYNVKGGYRLWKSEAWLFDRYNIWMEIPDIKFDASDRKVVSWGSARFGVTEYTEVNKQLGFTKSGQAIFFDLDRWKVLEAAKGDLPSIGITVNKHAPVRDIEYIKNLSRG